MIPPARWTSSMWYCCEEGATLQMFGVERLRRSMSVMVKSTPASWAAARMCSTVLVEPPMAMSRRMAFSKASLAAIERGSAEASPFSYQRRARSTMRRPASRNSCSRSAWVATTVPLPGSESPSASVRQFMELAVNMPEQEPQVGHAERSTSSTSSSLTEESPAFIMASMRSSLTGVPARRVLPASIGPPDTKIVGTLSRMAALSIPGVILSQFEMHTRASAQWALTMYSTESEMRSRLGRL